MTLFVLGCSSNQPVYFSSSTGVEYHSEEELKSIISNKVVSGLQKSNVLSKNPKMNEVNVTVSYVRRFTGDENSFASDSLAYPEFSYVIEALDSGKVVVRIEKEDLVYKGGDTISRKVIEGSLRDKKYEVDFAEAVANTVVKSISEL